MGANGRVITLSQGARDSAPKSCGLGSRGAPCWEHFVVLGELSTGLLTAGRLYFTSQQHFERERRTS